MKIKFFLSFCFLLFCLRGASAQELKKIHLTLEEGEMAVIFLSLPESNSLLFQRKESNLLYILSFLEDSTLSSTISLFTDHLDYVFMKEAYPLSYPYKILLDETVVLGNLQFEKNRFYYQGYTFCINTSSACDFLYVTEEIPIVGEPKVIFYQEDLSTNYVDSLFTKWVDLHKITQNSYTILFWKENYEVVRLDS